MAGLWGIPLLDDFYILPFTPVGAVNPGDLNEGNPFTNILFPSKK